MLNGNLWHELIHMYLAGYVVAGFIVAGVYATAHLRGKRDAYHRTGLVVALSFAALAAPAQVIIGDWAGREVTESQPIKLAAIEGLPTHDRRARRSRSAAGTTPDDNDDERRHRDPEAALAARATTTPTRRSRGLDTVPRDDRPPVNIVHYSFQVMVGIGTLLATARARSVVLTLWRHKRLPRSKWFYRGVIASPGRARSSR